MKQPVRIAAALAALAAVVVLFAAPLARSQSPISPSFLPVGTSGAGTSSVAWFHDPSGPRVMACQATPSAGGPALQCTVAKMP